jgi:hypothetical protein
MSRVRSANEKSIEKTINFLYDLKFRIDRSNNTESTYLQEKYNISKSTFSVVKKLKIVTSENGKFIWSKGEPNREMALLILEKLRVRQQKTAEPVKLPGFEDNIARIESLLTEIRDNAKIQQVLSNGLKTREKPQSLFVEQETKEATRIKILCAMASGAYGSIKLFHATDEDEFDKINNKLIIASTNLLNKFYSK